MELRLPGENIFQKSKYDWEWRPMNAVFGGIVCAEKKDCVLQCSNSPCFAVGNRWKKYVRNDRTAMK